jgi:hypothetical protein
LDSYSFISFVLSSFVHCGLKAFHSHKVEIFSFHPFLSFMIFALQLHKNLHKPCDCTLFYVDNNSILVTNTMVFYSSFINLLFFMSKILKSLYQSHPLIFHPTHSSQMDMTYFPRQNTNVHKTRINKFMETEIICTTFSNHNGTKVTVNNKRNHGM